jgi:hypothetical protein
MKVFFFYIIEERRVQHEHCYCHIECGHETNNGAGFEFSITTVLLYLLQIVTAIELNGLYILL